MTSLLEGRLKAKLAKAFHGKLTVGVLRRSVAGAVDDRGNATTPTITTYTFNGIRETWSARYHAQSGIPTTDVSVLILQGSLKPVTVLSKETDMDQLVYLSKPWFKWYKIRDVLEVDPAEASARLQCYEVPAPDAVAVVPEDTGNLLTEAGEPILTEGGTAIELEQ